VPSNAAHLEYDWTKQTGVHWTLQAVEYRTPSLVRLKKVRLLDDTANNTVFFAPDIDIQFHSANERELLKIFPGIAAADNKQNGYYQITVPASVLTLDKYEAAEAEAVVKGLLMKTLQRLPFLSETPLLFALDDCFISSLGKTQDEKPDRVRDIKGNLYCTANEIRSDWSFQLPAVSELETQKISVVKKRSGNGIEFTLRTGNRTLPCEIAGLFSAPFRQLGNESRFRGTFIVESGNRVSEEPTLRLEDVVFKNVSLAPLVKKYSPFSVSGTIMDFQIRKAAFGGGVFAAEGCTKIADGTIEKTLFHRLIDHFRLTVSPSDILDTQVGVIPFNGCAVHFKMQQDGIVFWGDKLWENGKLLMFNEGDGLRTKPMYILLPTEKSPVISYHAVLSVFAPDSAPVMPLTPGLQKIVGAIPVEQGRTSLPQPITAPSLPMVANPKNLPKNTPKNAGGEE
jgi:hypothetical protein